MEPNHPADAVHAHSMAEGASQHASGPAAVPPAKRGAGAGASHGARKTLEVGDDGQGAIRHQRRSAEPAALHELLLCSGPVQGPRVCSRPTGSASLRARGGEGTACADHARAVPRRVEEAGRGEPHRAAVSGHDVGLCRSPLGRGVDAAQGRDTVSCAGGWGCAGCGGGADKRGTPGGQRRTAEHGAGEHHGHDAREQGRAFPRPVPGGVAADRDGRVHTAAAAARAALRSTDPEAALPDHSRVAMVTDHFPIVHAQRHLNGYGGIGRGYALNRLYEYTYNLWAERNIDVVFFYIAGAVNPADTYSRNFGENDYFSCLTVDRAAGLSLPPLSSTYSPLCEGNEDALCQSRTIEVHPTGQAIFFFNSLLFNLLSL
ncbi:hypothetical protein ABB37_00476 [Leptomonas pyrrhocoris]|uniref:Uncharacterized protein n=1 Tax=Leptomonas pyrrhocoris TaxID=157538 RepID=A0A0M9GAI0_LEPPY|nr:hypothetical protein ABB37_00476 [Leptomonas pyrrhocoris]KPA86243.1 hypothetical protein ABB37_00476 [Leptomonas pyrrhocoris]|eukprot:XP_015664682.1 hypothetical protein ABB37_00476 [Leptomonas pyrrhocoris]